ncbi:alpha-mannosidase [Bacillus kwashiorkori]|uniref:alpha-mannosidase n=1 Tax=Bacillus kwashiorkori TaxID=1522318 RepID=UPI000780B049|nr:alpha-mannosidase [Bacillus kwashiorkori]
MTEKKTIHIISHTHWDREWYLPYEKHHVLLVKLMDRLIDTLDNDPEFKSYHLDGQTIILEDYLQVRPEMREKVKKYVEQGRIYIGPWYILQDEFLTSSEANIRNLQYGLKDAKEWGGVSKIGYFPDSFGNMGQAPQILKQAGIQAAAFGRGVKPTGFNNEVSDSDIYESPYSEMLWQSPDGSSILGILFANWYCNGIEIPVDEREAKTYWGQKIPSLEKYASTNHYLMMNGCDHQPIQVDLSKAIEQAKKLYPELDFVHSNFNDYVQTIMAELPKGLKTIDGELRSQKTDGWGTLVNTASARIYLKQMNQLGQVLLEKVAEPLATFAYMTGEQYPHHLFTYAWKTLMQNHPHDSICGCSVDEVHREMVTRFEKSKHVAEMIIDESLKMIAGKIDTSTFEKFGKDQVPFTVINTTGWERTGVVTVTVDVKREYYSEGVNKEALKAIPLDDRALVDSQGNMLDYTLEDLGLAFDYDLPEDRFRQAYMARRVRITFEAEKVPAFGFRTFAFVSSPKLNVVHPKIIVNDHEMENDFVSVKIADNGSLTVVDKTTGKTFNDLLIFEDTGDIGNEYMYKQPDDETTLTTENLKAKVAIVENTSFKATFEITHEWELPKGADSLLEQEQKEVTVYHTRKAQRVKETVPFVIKTLVSLEKNSKGISVKTTFNNQAKDHRLRALFPTDIKTNVHYADSIFEIAKRNNVPAKEWENPSNCQHQQTFVHVSDNHVGLTIANFGLNEYEILRDGRNTIALTLLRAVGELGDWGYFPTPEAQCLGEHTVEFRIYPSNGNGITSGAYKDAYQFQVPWMTKQVALQSGQLSENEPFINWESDKLAFTSLKVAETSGDIMMRLFNMTNEEALLVVQSPFDNQFYKSNVVEEKVTNLSTNESAIVEVPVQKHEIITIGMEKTEK